MMGAFFDTSYWRFFGISIAVHSALFIMMLYPAARPAGVTDREKITVSILETPERRSPEPTPIPEKTPAPPARKPSVIAKRVSPRPQAKPQSLPPNKQPENRQEAPVAPATEPASQAGRREVIEPRAPDPRETVPEQSVVAERPLPTVKELLPPITWSSESRGHAPVSLNTRDPVYVSYFTKIKQRIESQWEYPELALRYGLQGRLFLEFTIGADGQLERLRLVRSSGSQLLDEEALRAIRAAAPFPPIPRWIKPTPLSISAAMEYHDNRVDYQWGR